MGAYGAIQHEHARRAVQVQDKVHMVVLNVTSDWQSLQHIHRVDLIHKFRAHSHGNRTS